MLAEPKARNTLILIIDEKAAIADVTSQREKEEEDSTPHFTQYFFTFSLFLTSTSDNFLHFSILSILMLLTFSIW